MAKSLGPPAATIHIPKQGLGAGERREEPVLKHPVSEKRRFQNRESQRKYREKQRKRLLMLEDIAGVRPRTVVLSPPQSNASPELCAGERVWTIPGSHASSLAITSFEDTQEYSDPFHISENGFQAFNSARSTGQPRVSIPIPLEHSDLFDLWNAGDLPISPGRDRQDAAGYPYRKEGQTANSLRDHSQQWASSTSYLELLASELTSPLSHETPSAEQSREMEGSTERTIEEASPIVEVPEIPPLNNQISHLATQHAPQSDSNNPFSLPINPIAQLQPQSQVSTAPTRLPDLLANAIHISQLSFLAAYMANAALLGLTSTAATAHGTESPFHRPHLSKTSAHSLLYTEFAALKPDLQPSETQILYSHHPFLDILPFRTFRERAILLLGAETPMFEKADLCRDLLGGGLVCWGAGGGRRGSGTPWDIRSWEARPWFLKKWWMLAGGEGAEMYEQSRWWWGMRGEGGCE